MFLKRKYRKKYHTLDQHCNKASLLVTILFSMFFLFFSNILFWNTLKTHVLIKSNEIDIFLHFCIKYDSKRLILVWEACYDSGTQAKRGDFSLNVFNGLGMSINLLFCHQGLNIARGGRYYRERFRRQHWRNFHWASSSCVLLLKEEERSIFL